MKVRAGFVSNSSSSSFMVRADSSEVVVLIPMRIDFRAYGQMITTVEALEEYLCNGWYDSIEAWVKDYGRDSGMYSVYLEAKEFIEKGEVIYAGSVSNWSGDQVEYYLKNHGFPNSDKYDVIYFGG